MTENPIDTGIGTGKNSGEQSVNEQGQAVYNYASAGITEREGNVPVWLWFVVVSLLVWGVYYLVTYWSAPVGPM
ncbi:MAG: hypothetical protein HY799_12110 [Nitrosomonadales bacterium]|nr:hypothetical protein [Nitrosomonadales bacterium]